MGAFGWDTQDIGPQVALRDAVLPFQMIRRNVVGNDSIVTDHKAANMPTVGVINLDGRLRLQLRPLGTDDDGEILVMYVQFWPPKDAKDKRSLGCRAMKVTVTLGTVTTDRNPVTQADDTMTYREAKALTVDEASVPYETHVIVAASGTNIILDATGFERATVQVTLTTAASATIIGRPL